MWGRWYLNTPSHDFNGVLTYHPITSCLKCWVMSVLTGFVRLFCFCWLYKVSVIPLYSHLLLLYHVVFEILVVFDIGLMYCVYIFVLLFSWKRSCHGVIMFVCFFSLWVLGLCCSCIHILPCILYVLRVVSLIN